MGVTIKFNTQQLETSIRQTGEKALANGARSLRRIAQRVERLAKDYAPFDDGDLEKSIEIVEVKDERRRKEYIVRVDPDVVASTDDEGNEVKFVGDYALLIERGMSPYGDGTYKLGKKSNDKKATGKDVGGRFMRRAFEEGTERARDDIAVSIRAYLGGGRRITQARQRLMSPNDYAGDGE